MAIRRGADSKTLGLGRSAWGRAHALERNAFDAWNRRVNRRISILVGSALTVVGIGRVTEPVQTRTEFYAVIAQIMPVLMLVVAVEGGYFRDRSNASPFDRFLIRGFWAVSLVGVSAALVVVARGEDSVVLRGLVLYALMAVGVLVTVYAMHGPAPGQAGDERSR